MTAYMLAGATVFMFLERDNEVEERKKYNDSLNLFRQKYPQINETDLQILLNAHTEAESAGFIGNKRPRWDFSGAFYFVGTVVSTIGFEIIIVWWLTQHLGNKSQIGVISTEWKKENNLKLVPVYMSP
ncbi:potassium channel subfamily K member 13 [Mytilus galloprovincialis]|uniref:Potassium channel subfamily K member 13 n=1 Tax=Mytilus galloprovincialis TaxID=29158 RepID=A0A8B6FHS8_MYTGA|nr:potassium channel subfamily K member 13 [Mytilus galloprovincialis]